MKHIQINMIKGDISTLTFGDKNELKRQREASIDERIKEENRVGSPLQISALEKSAQADIKAKWILKPPIHMADQMAQT